MKRVDAVELAKVIWRMNQVAVTVNHDYAKSTLLYDRSENPAHQFANDIMTRDIKAETIIEKWRGAVLVLPDGSEEPMSPEAIPSALAKFRRGK